MYIFWRHPGPSWSQHCSPLWQKLQHPLHCKASLESRILTKEQDNVEAFDFIRTQIRACCAPSGLPEMPCTRNCTCRRGCRACQAKHTGSMAKWTLIANHNTRLSWIWVAAFRNEETRKTGLLLLKASLLSPAKILPTGCQLSSIHLFPAVLWSHRYWWAPETDNVQALARKSVSGEIPRHTLQTELWKVRQCALNFPMLTHWNKISFHNPPRIRFP